MIKTKLLIKVLFCVAVLFISCPQAAGEENTLFLAPHKEKIEMGLGFGGDTITFVGLLPHPDAALLIKVESENNPPLKLVRKGKVVIFWMSVKQFEVSNLPFLYKVICSGNLKDAFSANLGKKLDIGYEALKENMEIELLKGQSTEDDEAVVFDGFIKLKENLGLYGVMENAVNIKDDLSYAFDLTFSDRAVEGNYLVTCFAVKNSEVLGKTQKTITIEKAGMAKWLTDLSSQYSYIYGIVAVIVAIGVGLSVGFIFKGKGGH